MDKEKAARILSKELGDKLGRETIIEDSYKDSLIKNSLAVYQIGEPVILDFYEEKFHVKEREYKSVEGLMLDYDGFFAEANYYFLKSIPQVGRGQSYSKDSQFAATPYTLIGKKEEAALRKLFYKNVHPEIAYAMNILGIDSFIDMYARYKEYRYPVTSPFTTLKEDSEVMKKFINFAAELKYDKEDEVHKKVFKQLGGVGSLNTLLKRIGVDTCIDSSGASVSSYVHRDVISKIVEQLPKAMKNTEGKYIDKILKEFIDFVFFYLPVEEQNIESNKYILKSSQNIDFITAILSKEYSSGKYFQEYFEILDKEAQDKVVESLKTLSDKKPVHDSFLWSKGFKGIDLDYLGMYKQDANIFIDYFSKRAPEEKKTIIRDIINCDFVNEKVADWLNQNETDLLREVGLNG